MLKISNKKEIVANQLKERIDNGLSIKYKVFKNEDPLLLYAIERQFGSIFKCAKYLGIDEDTLVNKHGMSRGVNRRTLDEDEIRNRLYYLKSIGKLTTLAMRTEFEDLRLETSIKKVYGSVNNALLHFGLERDSRKVNLESLIKEVRKLYEDGEDISYANMIENHSKIIYNLVNKLNMSWYDVLDYLNIDFDSRRLLRYNDEIIKDKLNLLKKEFGTINYNILRIHESGLLNYINKNFDSIVDFYLKYDVDVNEAMDFNTQKIKGYMFERCFKEILDDLGITYEYNKHIENNTLRPDFFIGDTIIDCKLSSWTSSISSTVEKYSPHCKHIIIVFLRGKESHLKNTEDVTYRHVDYYLEKLPADKKKYYNNKLNNILNNDSFIESVTTIRTASN